MAKLLFLHGVGDGCVDGQWQAALRRTMVTLGYPSPDNETLIAKRYVSLLRQDPSPSCPEPTRTTVTLDGPTIAREKIEFQRRKAALRRLLHRHAANRGDAFTTPGSVPTFLLQFIHEARNYVADEGRRHCVVQSVLDELPTHGEIVIVGHSLGSLVAIDLLDYLPRNLTVLRLVTIGSPVGHSVMHGAGDRLLKEFPWSRVKSWANIWSDLDFVPAGRGIAHLFPQALDCRVRLGAFDHSAEHYVSDALVATAIGDAMFGPVSGDAAPLRNSDNSTLDDSEALILARLSYCHLLADELSGDAERMDRFVTALDEVQRDMVASIIKHYHDNGLTLPSQFRALADGQRPEQSPATDGGQGIPILLAIAGDNVLAPFEVGVPEPARKRALENLATFLGMQSDYGTCAFDALTAAKTALKKPYWSWDWDWSRIGVAGLGVGLVLAAPIGLWLAVPAGLYGAAGIVSALAAFGPGGMLGGMLSAGLMATAGTGAAVAALVSSQAPAAAVQHAVIQQLALAIARDLLKLPIEFGPWAALCDLETQIAHEISRLEPLNDSKSTSVQVLKDKAATVALAIDYMMKHGLAPGSE